MQVKGKQIEGKFSREFALTREAINDETRSVELSFSSVEPFKRWFGTEILSHDPKHVRMKRLASGTHPLLLQHDERQHIGVVEKAWIDTEDQKGRATVRFAPSSNRLAEEVYQDVKAGIRSLVSVGYRVHHFRKEEQLDENGDPIEDKTVYRADDWEPFEVSIVSIPADDTVGVGRSDDTEETAQAKAEETADLPPVAEIQTRKVEIMAEEKIEPTTPSKAEQDRAKLEERQAREKAEREAVAKEERLALIKKQAEQRIEEMYSIASTFGAHELLEKAKAEGWSVDQFRAAVLDRMEPGVIRTMTDDKPSNGNKSIGELFVESPMYRELAGKTGTRRNITLQMDRPSFAPQSRVFSATTEALTSIQKLPGVPGLLDQQQLYVSQLFPQAMTNALTIRYIKEDSYTQAATGVAESGTKPEATLNVSEVDATVRKIAVYVKVTDEMLADHEQMRGYIDGRLAYMIQSHEDDDLLNGTAAATEIVGVFQTAGINTYAVGAGTVIDAFGQAINKVRSLGFVEPDAIICHPDDWTNMILSKDSNGQYYAGGPFTGAYGVGGYSNVGRMFGLPVVVTTFCTKTTALVGAFRIGAQIFRRQGLTIEATNSEASDFINNRVTIRAEERLALAVYKPLAFCEITGIA